MSLNSLLLSLSVKLVLVHKLKPKTELLPTSDNLGRIYTFVILNMTICFNYLIISFDYLIIWQNKANIQLQKSFLSPKAIFWVLPIIKCKYQIFEYS